MRSRVDDRNEASEDKVDNKSGYSTPNHGMLAASSTVEGLGP